MPFDATQPEPPGLLRLLAVALLLATLGGCSGGHNVSSSGSSGIIPDSEVEDFTITETDSGRTQWSMFAKSAATYEARDLVTARTVRVDFFDEKGKKSSELVAREGELYRRTHDMTARGNVVLQTVEGERMTTEELHFLNSLSKITSDKLVRVEKEGSVLEGIGFESDVNLHHFEFKQQVRATVRPGGAKIVVPGGGSK